MMYRYGGYPGFGFGFEWIFMIIFWALIIWAVFAIIRSLSSGGRSSHWHNMDRYDRYDRPESKNIRDGEAMKILNERYAKGEIDKEEYEQKKEDLLKS